MSTIQSLPTDVVQLITAGEVIDSLAAVVRELVENALDAGATRITVSVWAEHWRLRVADNGVGMRLTDLRQAALSHSTSKIRGGDDLWHVTSLGFRGEALHSLAQLADLEICSREMTAEEAWLVVFDHWGQPSQVTAAAIAPGTVVTVAHLFSNWPSRRASMPSLGHQLRAVQRMIQQFALCHPQVTWQVEQDDRAWFTLYAGISARQVLPLCLPSVQSSDLSEYDQYREIPSEWMATGGAISNARLYLVLGLPDRCHRHRPDWLLVAVNGRCVQVPELGQAVMGGFRQTLPRQRYPVCFLHLFVPPQLVDWNRHPAKAELYLQQMAWWQEWIGDGVAEALGDSLEMSNQRVTRLLKTAEAGLSYQVSDHSVATQGVAETEGNNGGYDEINLDPKEMLAGQRAVPGVHQGLRALAQVHRMYIMAEHSSGVWLVEQHIAHERVLYEQLCDRWQLVSLPTPLVLEALSQRQVQQLQALTIDIEPFGEQCWVVRTAPLLLAQRADCGAALVELSLSRSLDEALVATACRSAIRNGVLLSLSAMQGLLNQWQRTRHPRTCPHGRPIYLALEESSLSRFFRRHWVIGKSHGI